jgi:acyl-CoA synthetase (AMP-forming)/AMP-acid ligase II
VLRTVAIDPERAADAYARDLWVPETLADSLREAAQGTPHREALIDSTTNDGTARLECGPLYHQAGSLAVAMRERMPVGSVVSFMLPNWHEAAVVYHAATMAGMVVNPILPSLRDAELQFILADAGSRMVFVPALFGTHDYSAMLHRVTAAMASAPDVVVVRGDHVSAQLDHAQLDYQSLTSTDATPSGLPTLDPDAIRMILYTSGTTGRPKGVLHSHNSIHALIRQIGQYWQIDAGDRFLVPSPIAHIGGSIYAFECPLLLGTTAVLMDRWNADDAVELLVRHRCTHMAGATPFLEQILAAARRAGTRLPDLKVFICGGASVPPSLIRDAADYFANAVVSRVYGSTEVPVTTVGVQDPADTDHAADTDGRAGIATIKLVDHPAGPHSADEICAGEIRARGPQMLLGYLHPEDDADAFDAEGFFRTGDLGNWVDGDYLVVSGRIKDIIIRNGENISPKEVEDILIDHPGITEIAVVGLPDPRTGEQAWAVIVTDALPEPDVGELRAFLKERGVATFKAPERVVVWDALPKNDAGKVLKHQIRARLVEADGWQADG